MKLVTRILLWAAGLIVLVVLGAGVAAWLLVDPEKFRPLIAESVQKATGRELTLEGPLGLDVLPCCSLTIERASLGNPPGFPAGPSANLERASLSLQLWPLLTAGRAEVGTVRVEGLDVRLYVRKDGAANWEFATGDDGAESGDDADDLAIERIEIRSGRIAYRDENDASGYLLEKLELDTGDVEAGEPFDLAIAGTLTDESDGTVADLSLATVATLAVDTGKLTMSKPLLDVRAKGGAVPGRQLTAKLGAAELALETEPLVRLVARNLQGEFLLPAAAGVAGDVEGSFVAQEAQFIAGTTTEASFPVLDIKLTVSGKEIPGDSIAAAIKATGLALDVDKSLGSVEALRAEVNGLGAALIVEGGGRMTEDGANLAGRLTLEPVSPRSLLTVLKEPVPKTADAEVLTRLSGTADWSLGSESLQLGNLALQLDQTKITGSLAMALEDEDPLRFDLRFDAIDLDRYDEPVATAEASPAAEDGDVFPVETLRDLNLDGRVRFGQLTYAEMRLADVTARIRAADGQLRLDPLGAALYGGRFDGAIVVDASSNEPKLTMEQKISALQIGAALKDLFATDTLTGTLSGSVSVRAAGNMSDALLRSLDGSVALDLADGVYAGTDVWHEIRSARARFRGEAPPAPPASPVTRIEKMQFAGDIADGVMTSDRLTAQVPFIRARGSGALNLVDETIDYRLEAEVFETPVFDDGTRIDDLTGIAIPLTLKGKMADPSVRVDIRRLATGVVGSKLKKKLLDRLGGGEMPVDGSSTATTEPPAEEKPRDALKRTLRDLLGQ
ncbi:MAG: AsmA family protein [Gammaproteobacteria bacterium]|nr:AsmA family protein [Gammaproteobacteria bacterium]